MTSLINYSQLPATFLIVSVFGCSVVPNPDLPPQSTPTTAPCPLGPQPLQTANISAANISGRWYVIDSDSSPGPIDGCEIRPKFALDIRQDAGRITVSSVQLADGGNGLIRFQEGFSLVNVQGTLSGYSIEQSPYEPGIRRTYSLKFNEATQHLEGVRDNTKIFFIPLVFSSLCRPPDLSCN